MPSQYNYRYIQFKRWTQNWGKERVSPFAPHQHDCWQLHSFIEEISLWFPRHARQPDPVLARDKMETHSHETVLLCNVLVQIGSDWCSIRLSLDQTCWPRGPPPPANETNPEVASLVSLPWWKMLEDVYVDSLEMFRGQSSALIRIDLHGVFFKANPSRQRKREAGSLVSGQKYCSRWSRNPNNTSKSD